MASGARGAETSRRQRPPEHPAPSAVPRLPAGRSGSGTRRDGWCQGWSLPCTWPCLHQQLKPPSPAGRTLMLSPVEVTVVGG